ncbi:MAG: hypothetical protein U5N86_08025 [Planctomycetota bacterium]|nr:hypothetical protein [Planctomycetota bacterium]
MNTEKTKASVRGTSIVEMVFVLAIFTVVLLAINSVIFSAQTMWGSAYPYSTLEEEALKIFRQLKGDLTNSAVMWAPSDTGLSYSDRLPHIPITNGNETDGYFGNELVFLTPHFDSDGRPILDISGDDIIVDYSQGNIVRYYVSNNELRREVTDLTDDSVRTDTITKHLASISFYDHDTAPTKMDSFYTVRVEIELTKRKFTGRILSISRNMTAFLRNSRGADDLSYEN